MERPPIGHVRSRIPLVLASVAVIAVALAVAFVSLPGQEPAHVGPQPDGSTLVPSNQVLRPAGQQLELLGRPLDIQLSPDEKWLVVKNSHSLDLVRADTFELVQRLSMAPDGASYTGLQFSADGRTIYMSDERRSIHVAVLEGGVLHWADSITLPHPAIGGQAVPTGLALDEAADVLYAALNRDNAVARIHLGSRTVSTIPVGVAPYAVVLASRTKAYVSNWGGRRPSAGEPWAWSSGTQVRVNEETGVASSGTVSVVDLQRGIETRQIGVGLHPSGMVLSPDRRRLYVACANSDEISVIDTASESVAGQILVRSRRSLPFGSAPNALAISPDGSRLYVANGGDNAICVIALGGSAGRVVGFIPTGWYPGAVVLDQSGTRLFVANVKGVGSRAATGQPGAFSAVAYLGTLSLIPVPPDDQLGEMTRLVESNNAVAGQLRSELGAAASSGPRTIPRFKHVVYIVKENRTYDQVLGDMPQGDGDENLVMFGRQVTPNVHALAERFGLLDNYYCTGAVSADGHQWTDEAYTTDYLEKFGARFARSYPFAGGDALAYASSGFIWNDVLRHGLTFRDYGEFVKARVRPRSATFREILYDAEQRRGQVVIRGTANLAQIASAISPRYPGFSTRVPDIYRASVFMEELREFERNGSLPNFIMLSLPNDHTSGTRPGLPTPTAAVADNDLALGRIVDALSHSRFWKDTCIFVTEDDAQNGLDHVDGHRSVGLVISPYSPRGAVVSATYTQVDMVRTIEAVLGLPAMNQFDLRATPMYDCFTQQADLTPYSVVPNEVPLDQMNPRLQALSGQALKWARTSLAQDLDEADEIDDNVFNQIIWHAVKGYDTPYPVLTPRGMAH